MRDCSLAVVTITLTLVLSMFAEVCGISLMERDNMMLSDEAFHEIQSCMIGSGFRFEELPTNTHMIRSFIDCCITLLSPLARRQEKISYTSTDGADGRDMLSMSVADIQNIFSIDQSVSNIIFNFIARQLTAHLPSRR